MTRSRSAYIMRRNRSPTIAPLLLFRDEYPASCASLRDAPDEIGGTRVSFAAAFVVSTQRISVAYFFKEVDENYGESRLKRKYTLTHLAGLARRQAARETGLIFN